MQPVVLDSKEKQSGLNPVVENSLRVFPASETSRGFILANIDSVGGNVQQSRLNDCSLF